MQPLSYLDAGTGSMLVSAIVAGAAGVGVILRLSWRRIVRLFSPKQRSQAGQEAGNQQGGVSSRAGASAEPRT